MLIYVFLILLRLCIHQVKQLSNCSCLIARLNGPIAAVSHFLVHTYIDKTAEYNTTGFQCIAHKTSLTKPALNLFESETISTHL